MSTDFSKYKEFKKHVRLRPAMYVGNEIVIGLVKKLIMDCIRLCNTDMIKFEITLFAGRKFSIRLSSKENLTPFFRSFKTKNVDFKHYSTKVLKAISKDLVIADCNGGSSNIITFSLDENIVKNVTVDYLQINDEFLQLALLYRDIIIVSIDKRRRFVNRICYHFPEGIIYLFERAVAQVLGKPKIKLIYDGELNSRKYQICLGYRTDWDPEPFVASFANERATASGGSLVDGVVDGLVSACRKFAKETNADSLKIKRKSFRNGLILVCAVSGGELANSVSFEEILESDIVKREAKSISERLVLTFFRERPDLAVDFLSRFDVTNPVNVMY